MIPRKLTELDKQKLINHLTSLHGDDRRLRFGGFLTDELIADYVNKSFDGKSKWFGVDHIDGRIVAACHAAVMERNDAELGCSVDPEFRNQGYAQLMFDRAVTWLRTQGVKEVFMHCLTENAAMRHIARKNDMAVVSYCGDSDAKVDVEPATPVTHLEDAYLDRIALYDMVVKNNLAAFNFYLKRK